MALPDPHDEPTVTIERAADVLGISRGSAYGMAKAYRESGGEHGLPVIVCGPRRFKVPTAALLRMLQLDDAA